MSQNAMPAITEDQKLVWRRRERGRQNAIPAITEDQKLAWRRRERGRFRDGTYMPLPADWTSSCWWQYGVKTWEAAEKGLLVYRVYSDPHENHFAHVSTKDGAAVSYTENDIKGVADRQAPAMKPGRYLKKFFGHVLTDEEIRDLATAFCAEFKPLELKWARTADEIEHVYLNGPDSCMSHDDSYYNSSVHPVRAYGDSDLALAYVEREEDDITARVICWPAKKLYSCAYGDATRLLPLLKAEGYNQGDLRGARIRAVRDSDGWLMPYIDHIGYCEHDGGKWMTLGKGDICCHPTCGLAEDGPRYTCEACGDSMGEDDSYPIDGCDGYYCESCQSELSCECARSGNWYHRDDMVEMANGDMWHTRQFDRHGGTCARTDGHYPANELIPMADGEFWCQDAFDEFGATSAADGLNYPADECVTLADGTVWQREHFEKYGTVNANGDMVRQATAPDDKVRYRCPDTPEMDLEPVTVRAISGWDALRGYDASQISDDSWNAVFVTADGSWATVRNRQGAISYATRSAALDQACTVYLCNELESAA